MCPPVSVVLWAGWLCALLPGVSTAHSQITVYGRLGSEVALTPDAVSATITNIMWTHGQNIVIQWDDNDGKEIDVFRHFQGRVHLNTSNGVMTITGLSRNDSGMYTPEINHNKGTPVHLTVISAVLVPTVSKSCDEERTLCNLTCDGDTRGAEPVTYKWKSDNDTVPDSSGKTHAIVKEDSSSIKDFTCELKNPVSQESSQPIPNPFIPPGGLKISTGLIVFICLLAAVLLLVVFHRLKAGMWFFEKGSMPWQADFWRKHEPEPKDPEINGTTALQHQGQADERTLIAETTR